MTGRPTSLTPELQAEIVRYLEEGAFLSTAAVLAGTTYKSVKEWRKRGLTGEEPFAAFRAATKKADAKAEQDAMRAGKEGGPGWQAKFRFLESRFREHWGRRLETDDKTGAPLSVAEQFRRDRERRKAKP